MQSLSDLGIKIFADGADKAGMLEMRCAPRQDQKTAILRKTIQPGERGAGVKFWRA